MKQVREFSDCDAYVVLNKKGEHVATVQARFGSGGAVQVDVWARKPGEHWLSLVHQHKAGGYGYDKFTAALSGAVIEGYTLANHCGYGEPAHEKAKARLMRAYQKAVARGVSREETRAFEDKAQRIGCNFANWRDGAWHSLHTMSGLARLEAMGFKVIRAL